MQQYIENFFRSLLASGAQSEVRPCARDACRRTTAFGEYCYDHRCAEHSCKAVRILHPTGSYSYCIGHKCRDEMCPNPAEKADIHCRFHHLVKP